MACDSTELTRVTPAACSRTLAVVVARSCVGRHSRCGPRKRAVSVPEPLRAAHVSPAAAHL